MPVAVSAPMLAVKVTVCPDTLGLMLDTRLVAVPTLTTRRREVSATVTPSLINHGDGKMKPVNECLLFHLQPSARWVPVAKPVPIPAKAVVPVFQ